MSLMTRLTLAALLAVTVLGWGSSSSAQDAAKDKDGDLEKFLKNVDDAKADDAKKETKAEAQKPSKDVPAKDKDLDNFLEKLGERKETPAPDDEKEDEHGQAPKPGKPAPGPQKKTQEEIDRRLEELSGRTHKKKDQDGAGGNSPLAKLVKEMREVEERLGKPDTGEEDPLEEAGRDRQATRSAVIQAAKASGGSGKKKMVLVMQPGQKPGQPSEQQGNTGGNAPHTKPLTPNNKRSLAGGKDEWGHLPPELRQEMDNVFKEEGLPSKQDLIRRYYLSLTKKTVNREEGR